MKHAVQQLMLGTAAKSYKTTLDALLKIKSMGYDGIELNGFMIRPSTFLVKALTSLAGMPVGNAGKLDWPSLIKESCLEVPAIHEDLGTIERQMDAVLKETEVFNTSNIVITGMYRFDYTNKEELLRLATRLNQAGKTLGEHGLHLCYHNHNCELLRIGAQTAYDLLIEQTDPNTIFFEFDSYWFQEAGADPKLYMKRLEKRMLLWHATDRGSRHQGTMMTPIVKSDCVELGKGNMDLAGLLSLAEENEAQAMILETHKNWIDNDPLKSMEVSAQFWK